MDSTVASPTSSSPTGNGSAPAPSGIALEPGFYTDPALEAAEQELIFERTWQLAGHVSPLANTGSYITAAAGSQPVLVVRDDDGAAARLPQRLPPPRLAAAERLGPVQGGDPLPLPRLDLQDGRIADRRAGGDGLRREAGQERR